MKIVTLSNAAMQLSELVARVSEGEEIFIAKDEHPVAAPKWLAQALTAIHELAFQHRVYFTNKALLELEELGLGLDLDDACQILEDLTRNDFVDRLVSGSTGEWMYVFKPLVSGLVVYLKMILRDDCVVISFHEDHRL